MNSDVLVVDAAIYPKVAGNEGTDGKVQSRNKLRLLLCEGVGNGGIAPMEADQDDPIAVLTDAQALTALSVFTVRMLERQGLTVKGLEQALAADPAADQAIRSALTADPRQTAGLARDALAILIESDIDPLADMADQAALDAENAATLQGPVTLLIGGGVAIGLLFVLLLDHVGPDGVVMRQKMPIGLAQVLEKAGGLVEKVTKLIAELKTVPAGKD